VSTWARGEREAFTKRFARRYPNARLLEPWDNLSPVLRAGAARAIRAIGEERTAVSSRRPTRRAP
jgi:hypothetical protein